MTTLLQLQVGSKSYGAKNLFDSASFGVNEREHVGVIGPNGAGKSTLFKILCGFETLDSGQVIRSSSLRLGYLAQEDTWRKDETAEEFLSRDMRLPIWELKGLGRRLGLNETLWHVPITALSGGYRMRIKLLALLGQEPNLMLLDEPTNYLDLETVLALENFLLDYSGAFLLISHDREFLRRVTDHVIEIEGGDISKYPGNIDDYFEQKDLIRSQLEKRAMSLEAKRQEILMFAAKFGAKATKARQAQSRLKSLAKMESIEIKPLPVQARIRIPPPARTGETVLRIENATLGYGEKEILKNVSLTLGRGNHVAVIGLNGAGKSTLLKTIANELQPLSGSLNFGAHVSIGYFAQHVSEKLNPNDTVFEALARRAHPDVVKQEILDIAGSLLFSGSMIDRKIANLSGGEKARVALGQNLLERNSCLVFDEPTNHLDFDTVEALTQALNEFAGTVVFVSHDRGFVSRIANKILEVKNGSVSVYPGSYDDYVWSLQQGMLSGDLEGSDNARSKPSQSQPVSTDSGNAEWEQKKENQKRLRAIEKTLAVKENEMQKLEKQLELLSEKAISAIGKDAAEIGRDIAKTRELLAQTENHWMSLLEEKEELQK